MLSFPSKGRRSISNGFFSELRRRNVVRVAGVYAVVGWLVAQAAALLEASLGLPGWFDGVIEADAASEPAPDASIAVLPFADMSAGADQYRREAGFPPQCRPVGKDDFACE